MTLGSFHLRTRVVIITDGKPTDFGTENSEDICESMGLDKVRANASKLALSSFCNPSEYTFQYLIQK